MEAKNRNLSEWLADMERGILQLPRFQRDEVWGHERIRKFLGSILRQYPLGVLLLLEVNSNNPPFHTRTVAGLPENPEQPCREHLLDGQQRLSALARALMDNYPNRTFYVEFEKRNGTLQTLDVVSTTKSRPWFEDAVKEYEKKFIPIRILAPGERDSGSSRKWRNEVYAGIELSDGDRDALDAYVEELRIKMSATQLPYLSIPQETGPHQAIDIFRDINTSAVQLTSFEIANALCEKEIAESLEGYVSRVRSKTPILARLEGDSSFGDLVLKIACIDQGLKPKESSYKSLEFKRFKPKMEKFIEALVWLEKFLVNEGLWDSKWLPSTVPFRVLPILYSEFGGFKRHKAADYTALLRCYLWRAFLTERYIRQANDRLYEDFKVLKVRIEESDFAPSTIVENSIFDLTKYTLPSTVTLLEQEWPTTRGILKKAVLAISVKKGAYGLETNERYGKDSKSRDHHHIFPKALFDRDFPCSMALNCMMLEAEANSSWKDQWPGDYLTGLIGELSERHGDEAECKVIERLESHTLTANILIAAKDGKGRKVETAFKKFVEDRADMVLDAMRLLFDGHEYK